MDYTTTAVKPIGKCDKCGFDIYEYMTHFCPTNSEPIGSPGPLRSEVEEARAWQRVQQKDANGCVVASLAMLTGDDYDRVKSEFQGHDFSANGVCSEWEGCNYLTMRGFAYQKVYKHDSLKKRDREEWPILWSDSPLLVGYLAQVHLGQFVHAVAVTHNGTVLDPYRDGVYQLSDYERVNHLIAVFDIRESRMQRFAAHIRQQERERAQKILDGYEVGIMKPFVQQIAAAIRGK